jgi:hypothetical protein
MDGRVPGNVAPLGVYLAPLHRYLAPLRVKLTNLAPLQQLIHLTRVSVFFLVNLALLKYRCYLALLERFRIELTP